MGQYGTSEHMKGSGLITICDQLKFKKLLAELHSAHGATVHSTTTVKGKRTLAEINKMSAEDT